ncbi:DUF4397 domain-containing protein [Halobacillus kuroshimensis]|uniref:DUF4397 domain-containing protein n=1 Tax=Halobacillus kuroshimensis TaxID=302481 RepID=A0ABS3DS29_9BACI|nr:DUF4397 domain-containing protein [Halobacillus kuroshimensis]MBN8234155.1 DUF4397 domain-containing protein [Halobacillus kuroshimensis]
MYSNENPDQLAWQAMKYDMLSNYYKYIDPNKAIHYYHKHLQCMQQWVMCERSEGMGMGGGGGGTAKVRVLHASPDAPNVDVYVNGQKILENVPYKQQSEYLEVPQGQYRIDIYAAGDTTQPVLTQNVAVEADRQYTVAAAGKVNQLQLIPVVDNDHTAYGNTKVRFWHLSPNAPAVDVAVKGGDVLFRNVPFGRSTRYITVPPTTADLEVRVAGTNQVVLEVPGVTLNPNEAYTAVAVGLAGEQPPLEAIFLQP